VTDAKVVAVLETVSLFELEPPPGPTTVIVGAKSLVPVVELLMAVSL
jgi:hypothetical protein